MNATEQEKQIVDELAAVMKKHRKHGTLFLVDCIRMAYEKEMGYAPKPTPVPVKSKKKYAQSNRSRMG